MFAKSWKRLEGDIWSSRKGKGFQVTQDHREWERALKQHVTIKRGKELTSNTWPSRERKGSQATHDHRREGKSSTLICATEIKKSINAVYCETDRA